MLLRDGEAVSIKGTCSLLVSKVPKCPLSRMETIASCFYWKYFTIKWRFMAVWRNSNSMHLVISDRVGSPRWSLAYRSWWHAAHPRYPNHGQPHLWPPGCRTFKTRHFELMTTTKYWLPIPIEYSIYFCRFALHSAVPALLEGVHGPFTLLLDLKHWVKIGLGIWKMFESI